MLLALACFLALPSCRGPARSAPFEAKVVGVSDGDTITVLAGTEQVKVRLYGIDCPERGQPFGGKARQLTSELAFGKVVTVRS